MRFRTASPLLTFLCRLSFFFIICHGCASTTAAFCPRTKIFVNNEFFKSRFVVIGKVLSAQEETDPNGYLVATHYQVRVDKSYRGPKRIILRIVSENGSGRFPMEIGQKYLLFVRNLGSYLEISNCGNSRLLSDTGGAITAIEQIGNAAPFGEIDMSVALSQGSAAGIRFVARSGEKSFSAITDENGSAHLRVPPGRYEVSSNSTKLWIIPYDLNEDDPDHFVVHRGGCVQLDYDASPK
jgi:hypothetical protein